MAFTWQAHATIPASNVQGDVPLQPIQGEALSICGIGPDAVACRLQLPGAVACSARAHDICMAGKEAPGVACHQL